jgi:hypothetical protein
MKLQESHEQDMCVLVAPDGSWQAMTLSPDYASCLAMIRMMHKAGMIQSYHDLVKMKGFEIIPVKVTVIDSRPEEEIQKDIQQN